MSSSISSLVRVAVAVLAVGAITTSAQAQDGLSFQERSGMYGVVKGGFSILSVDRQGLDDLQQNAGLDLSLDNGLMGAVGVGTYYGPLRTEFELSYIRGSTSGSATYATPSPGPVIELSGDNKFQAITPMLNLYYDFPIVDRFSGYVGGGLGWAFVSHKYNYSADGIRQLTVDDESNDFAGQLLAGLGYAITDSLTLTAGYRSFVIISTSDWVHNVELGLRFDF